MITALLEASAGQMADTTASTAGQGIRVSIFGIIIVGLFGGLIVGLLTSPNFTLQGFFLGFAGGSLITVAAYFLAAEKGGTSK